MSFLTYFSCYNRFMIIRTSNLMETYDLARAIVFRLRPKTTGASILALSGDLGSGKTAFTQGLAKALGISDAITSPTFVIEKIYQVTGSSLWKRVIHIDAYRLAGGSELMTLGFGEIIKDPYNIVIIEWPEKVSDVIPADAQTISFKFIDEEIREISYEEK